MAKTLVRFRDGLIGDFLGGAPTLYSLGEYYNGEVDVEIHNEIRPLANMLEKNYTLLPGVGVPSEYNDVVDLDSSAAFAFSIKNNLYMSQAYMGIVPQLYGKIPAIPPKAKINIVENNNVPKCDFIISPFARSLPEEQKVRRDVWNEFIFYHPELKFVIVGNSTHDSEYFIDEQDNVETFFSKDFNSVCNLFKNAKHGLISVVTGTSHLAFHLGVKNYLLTNQNMVWGNNPNAITLSKYIPHLTFKDLNKLINI